MSYLFASSSFPRKIQIEITNRCNLSCAMCPRTHFGQEYRDMDLYIFERILAKINSPMEIILTGWGEPLMHPDIYIMAELCKRKALTVRMTTNGTLLTQEAAKRLVVTGIDSVIVSADSFQMAAGTDLRHQTASLEENIKNLIRVRQNKSKPQVVLQPTLHKGKENDVFDLVKKGKQLGVDMINIVRLDRRFNKNLDVFDAKEEQGIIKKIIQFSDEVKIRVDVLPFTAFAGIKRFLYRWASGFWFRVNRRCPKTYNYLYITNTGKVTPCCGLPKYVVGDILTSSLEEIWGSQAFKAFRNKQLSVCAGCDTLSYPR